MPEANAHRWRLGLLASHRGSNLQAIVDACRDGRLPAVPAVVISNNADSGAIERARRARIPARVIGGPGAGGAAQLDQALLDTLREHRVDLVVLAGFMKRIGPKTLEAYRGRIVNVHPALLPAHGGRGMYGERVHAAVLAAGETETGVTIHLVDEDYDTGQVLAQRRVPVLPGDSVESLAARVLPVEHELYVETLGRILRGEIPIAARTGPA